MRRGDEGHRLADGKPRHSGHVLQPLGCSLASYDLGFRVSLASYEGSSRHVADGSGLAFLFQ